MMMVAEELNHNTRSDPRLVAGEKAAFSEADVSSSTSAATWHLTCVRQVMPLTSYAVSLSQHSRVWSAGTIV